MNGRTEKHDVYRTITFNRSCNVLKVNPRGKTAYGAKRHNGKCNICAFHEEIHAFEDWIFVRFYQRKSEQCFCQGNVQTCHIKTTKTLLFPGLIGTVFIN